jgi:hypothetical protein
MSEFFWDKDLWFFHTRIGKILDKCVFQVWNLPNFLFHKIGKKIFKNFNQKRKRKRNPSINVIHNFIKQWKVNMIHYFIKQGGEHFKVWTSLLIIHQLWPPSHPPPHLALKQPLKLVLIQLPNKPLNIHQSKKTR